MVHQDLWEKSNPWDFLDNESRVDQQGEGVSLLSQQFLVMRAGIGSSLSLGVFFCPILQPIVCFLSPCLPCPSSRVRLDLGDAERGGSRFKGFILIWRHSPTWRGGEKLREVSG